MDHLSPSRSCSPLLIVPVLCDLVAKALCRMPIVSGAPGAITSCQSQSARCIIEAAVLRLLRGWTLAAGEVQPKVEKRRCSAAAEASRITPEPNGLPHVFIPLVTPQPLCQPSVTSPPCLLRNYLLFRGSPRCGLLLLSEHRGGNKKGAGEREISVHLKEERSGLRVGDLPSMMGILLPSLLQRKRGLREICRKVKRPYRF